MDPLIKARVLAQAGFDLRALGRLKEASLILEKAFSAFTRLKQWGPAASVASNLSVLNLHCCRLADAVAIAREGVKLADRSKEPFRRWWERTTLADALHQVGKIREAGRVFAQAERIAEHIADADELEWRFHHGFRYNDFLLTQGAAGAVRKLGLNAIKTAQQSGNVLRAGAGHLYIARADMYESTVGAQTVMHMNEGVQLICRAGQQHFIPKALLTRAQLFRSLGDYQAAANDLARGIAIAERGGMLLYTCDYELEHTRLFLAQGDLAGANPHFQVARDLVARTGYHRRDAEVSELDGLIARRPLSNTGERKKGARRTAR